MAAISHTVYPKTYTTAELNSIIGRLVGCMNVAGNKYYKGIQYVDCQCEAYTLFKKMVRAYYLLSNWQQNANGGTNGYTNKISQTQLTATVMWVKQHCNC